MRKLSVSSFSLNRILRPLLLLFILCIGYIGNAQPLSGILPKYGAYVDQPNVNFSWNRMEGAVDYTVVLAQDPFFVIGVFQSPALTTNTWISTPLSYGTWYWKVQANDGSSIFDSPTSVFTLFKPDLLAGNTMWLSAESNVNIPFSTVSSWEDVNNNGIVLNQSAGVSQPILVNNVANLNNKSVIRFDGVDDFFDAGDVLDIGTNSITTFMLVKGTGSYYAKFGSASAPQNIYGCYNIGAEQGHELAGSSYQNFSSTNSTDYHVISFWANRTSNQARLRRNFNIISSGAITGIINQSYDFNTPNSFLMGRYSYTFTPFYLNGDVAEVIFYNVPLSDSDRLRVESYLNDKYAPGVNLGKDTTLANFCPYTITAPSGYTNLLWSTGETTATISVTTPGQYWLRGTNLFGVMSYDTIFVNFPEIADPLNLGICVNGSNIWNVDLGPGFTYLWSDGSTAPSLSISTPGTYSVEVTGPGGCSKNSGDFTFTIDNYETTAFLGNDTTLCSGNLIALQVGAGETEEYYWNGISSGAQPSFWAVDTTGNYFLESVNVNGCVARDTIYVDIIGEAPVAGFSVSNVCDQSAAVFTDTSSTPDLSPVDEWLWTFGDGQQSTEQNPQHIFSSGPGTYNVQLYVAQGGCGAFFNAPIEVFQLPQANFSMSGFCDAEASAFVDQSIEGSGGITGWLWNFGQPSSGLANVSVQQNPSKSYGETGNFMVTLEVTDANNCTNQEVQTITINKSPLSEFTASDICAGDNITFSNSSSIPSPDFIQSYLWDFGDNTYSILPVPGKTYTSPGYRTISLNVTAGNGCSTTSQQQILVHAIPVPGILVGPSCVGTYTSLTDVSQVLTGVVASSSWEIDLNTTLAGSPAAYVFTTAGSHNIELTTTSDFGCTNDTMIVINVSPELDAYFEVFPSVVIVGEPVEFQNNSVGAINYSWELGDGTLSSNFEPINTYGPQWIDSTLTAILYVTNSYGCEDTTSVDFSVNKARFDLEVRKLFVSEQNGFYNVGVELKNVGTALIEYTDVELRLSNGTAILERFEDTLLSGQTKIKVFTSKPSTYLSTQDAVNAWICAEGTPYSALNLPDEDLSNNRYCRNAEGEEPVLIGPNPNPASTEFEFSVLVSKESVLTVDLIDARGRIVKSYFDATTVTPGLYTYTVSLLGVNSGVYLLRMNGEVKRMVVE